jgi:hypothetical protein
MGKEKRTANKTEKREKEEKRRLQLAMGVSA